MKTIGLDSTEFPKHSNKLYLRRCEWNNTYTTTGLRPIARPTLEYCCLGRVIIWLDLSLVLILKKYYLESFTLKYRWRFIRYRLWYRTWNPTVLLVNGDGRKMKESEHFYRTIEMNILFGRLCVYKVAKLRDEK